MKVLFVCTGNTCRSYMAQVILEKLSLDNDIYFEVSSAGIQAHDGIPAYPYARLALKRNGYLDKKHYSQSLMPDLVKENDLIITMEIKQRDYLRFSFPNYSEKIKTLSEIAVDSEIDIPDPIALEYREYEKVFKQIEDYTKRAFEIIVKENDLVKKENQD